MDNKLETILNLFEGKEIRSIFIAKNKNYSHYLSLKIKPTLKAGLIY